MKSVKTKKDWLLVIICGIAIGFLNGFFGGGGGMVCVPLLEHVLKLESKNAHASTIAVILPLSVISSIIYIVSNDINFMQLGFVTLGVCIGGVLGAFALKKLKSNIVRIIFVIIMIVAGVTVIIR